MTQQEAFQRLAEKSHWVVPKVCEKYLDMVEDRGDIIQEIWLQAWKSYPNFRGNSTFSTWLYALARYTCIDYMRRAKNKAKIISLDNALYCAVEYNDYLRKHEVQVRLLYQCIEKLPNIYAEVVLLYLDGNDHKQIASILGIKDNLSRVRFDRAKDKLKKLIYYALRSTEGGY